MAVAPDEPSLAALAGQAIDEGKALVAAEIALVKAKAAERVTTFKAAAILFAISAVVALLALIALPVGIILALATVIGPGWATLAVVGVMLVIAAVFAMLGKQRLARPRAVSS